MAIAAVGTAGLRIAPQQRRGRRRRPGARPASPIEVISGRGGEPARLPRGARRASGSADGPVVVFDTGGGSSQFTFGDGDQVDERFSVDVGAVRFTERFGLDGAVSTRDARPRRWRRSPPTSRGSTAARARTRSSAWAAPSRTSTRSSTAWPTYDPDVVQGTVLDRAEIDRQIELYRTRDADERRSIVGLQPARAEVILAGACVVRTVLDKLGATRSRSAIAASATACWPSGSAVSRSPRETRAHAAAADCPSVVQASLGCPGLRPPLADAVDLTPGSTVTALIVPKNLGYAGIAGSRCRTACTRRRRAPSSTRCSARRGRSRPGRARRSPPSPAARCWSTGLGGERGGAAGGRDHARDRACCSCCSPCFGWAGSRSSCPRRW